MSRFLIEHQLHTDKERTRVVVAYSDTIRILGAKLLCPRIVRKLFRKFTNVDGGIKCRQSKSIDFPVIFFTCKSLS